MGGRCEALAGGQGDIHPLRRTRVVAYFTFSHCPLGTATLLKSREAGRTIFLEVTCLGSRRGGRILMPFATDTFQHRSHGSKVLSLCLV